MQNPSSPKRPFINSRNNRKLMLIYLRLKKYPTSVNYFYGCPDLILTFTFFITICTFQIKNLNNLTMNYLMDFLQGFNSTSVVDNYLKTTLWPPLSP